MLNSVLFVKQESQKRRGRPAASGGFSARPDSNSLSCIRKKRIMAGTPALRPAGGHATRHEMKIMLTMLRAALLPLLLLTAAPVMAAEFLLFYSNDMHGETEPCG